MGLHKCLAGCGRIITWQFALCRSCEKRYGSSPLNWPDWLRFLWRDVQRERRQTVRVLEHEVPFGVMIDNVTPTSGRKNQRHRPAD